VTSPIRRIAPDRCRNEAENEAVKSLTLHGFFIVLFTTTFRTTIRTTIRISICRSNSEIDNETSNALHLAHNHVDFLRRGPFGVIMDDKFCLTE
jgi:hypothetical protein